MQKLMAQMGGAGGMGGMIKQKIDAMSVDLH